MTRKAGAVPEETKMRLLESAALEFASYGFAKASLRRICANAEVTTGALYFFFQDKEDLFRQTLSPATGRILALLVSHYEAELASSAETLAKNEEEDFRAAEEFLEFYDDFSKKGAQVMSEQLGISQENISLLLPTLVLYKRLLEETGAENVVIVGTDLGDGLAYDYAEKNKIVKPRHNFENDIIESARNIAKRYHTNRNHAQMMERLALTIFDKMKSIHGLEKRERLLLQISVLLHDCGKYINMAQSSECSYNIIMATEIIGLSHAEREMVANIVRFNSSPILSYEELAAGSLLGREEYLTIAKLTAILRVANAMDRSHKQKIKDIRVTMKGNHTMQILVDTFEDLTLEQALFKEKAEFFEEVYSIRPELKAKRLV